MKAVVQLTILCAIVTLPSAAQQRADSVDAPPTLPQPTAASLTEKIPHPNEKYFLQHLAIDQKNIWTSPAHLKPDDGKWLLPSAGIAVGLFVTDPDSSFGMASYHPNTWKEVSNYGLGAALGTMYV